MFSSKVYAYDLKLMRSLTVPEQISYRPGQADHCTSIPSCINDDGILLLVNEYDK